MKENVVANVSYVCPFGRAAHVPQTHQAAHLIQKLWLWSVHMGDRNSVDGMPIRVYYQRRSVLISSYVALGEIMKQILITVFCFGLCGFCFACASKQENIAASSSEQNAPLTKAIVETMPPPEPTPSPLTDNHSERRAEVHNLMLKGEYLHDGSIELEYIGDISSVPALLAVLKEYPPGIGGGRACPGQHALDALRKITGANPGIKNEDWSAWWKQYQKKQKAKEKQVADDKAT